MAAATTQTLPLSSIYPINTLMELTLNNNNSKEVTTGTIYCTDEVSNTIVLKKSLVHTTLTSEITVINAAVVTDRRIITAAAAEDEKEGEKTVLPNVSRRMVEERERRAIKLMEESFSHVNQQVRLGLFGGLFVALFTRNCVCHCTNRLIHLLSMKNYHYCYSPS